MLDYIPTTSSMDLAYGYFSTNKMVDNHKGVVVEVSCDSHLFGRTSI
jgi:hypothetical protein